MATATIKAIRQIQVRHGVLACEHRKVYNITFDEPFTEECIGVTSATAQSNFGGYSTISITNPTKNGFDVSQANSANAAMSINWVAFGY